MNKELQNKAWAVLPKEFREEVKKLYTDVLDAIKSDDPDDRKWGYYRINLLEDLFGKHNLTSDTEPKFKVGDKVVVSFGNGERKTGYIYEVLLNGAYDIDLGDWCMTHNVKSERIVPYIEPKQGSESAQNENKQLRIMTAAEIAAGICCNSNTVEMAKYNRKEEGEEHVVIAQYAIKIADALIEEINGKGGSNELGR